MKTIDKLVDTVVIATVLAVLFTAGEAFVLSAFLITVNEDLVLTANMLAGATLFNYALAAIVLIGEKIQDYRNKIEFEGKV